MVEHRNTTVTVRVVLKACEAVGVDTTELLQLAGIERETVDNPDGEVSFDQMRAFWQNAFRLSNDPFLGMHAAQYTRIGDYQCLDYLTTNAATLGQSLENYCRYMAIINTWIGWQIDEGDKEVVLRMLPNAGKIPPHSYEFVFSMYVKRMRELSDESWRPAGIRFPFPAPEQSEKHADYFAASVQYDAEAGEFIVDKANWQQAIANSDQQLYRVLDEHARLLLSQRPMPEDFAGRVRQEIVRELHGGNARRETIAQTLNMSSRTLQRRLEEQGVAFAELLDDVRADLAKNKLSGSDLSLGEIGFLLGFSEQSAFNRAFKRWTGKTPREYRLGVTQG